MRKFKDMSEDKPVTESDIPSVGLLMVDPIVEQPKEDTEETIELPKKKGKKSKKPTIIEEKDLKPEELEGLKEQVEESKYDSVIVVGKPTKKPDYTSVEGFTFNEEDIEEVQLSVATSDYVHKRFRLKNGQIANVKSPRG